jgi:hypothetical protein
MQGDSPPKSGNMDGFDFALTWQTVDGGDAGVAADGYPILAALDEARQLTLQGISIEEVTSGVVVEANNVTFANNTVKNDG